MYTKQGNDDNYKPLNVPVSLLADKNISCKARGLFITILGFVNGSEFNINDIREHIKEGRDGFYSILNELIKHGYVQRMSCNNGCFCSEYRLVTIVETKVAKPQKKVKENKETIKKQDLPLDERKKAFVDTIKPYVKKYGGDMCNDFFAYWTEPFVSNPNKMRFEAQKTWSIGGRLATWHKNEKTNYGRNTTSQTVSRDEQKRIDSAERQKSVAERIITMRQVEESAPAISIPRPLNG